VTPTGVRASAALLLLAALLFWPVRVSAQGVGFFQRTNCANLTAPVSGATVCWDTTTARWKVYNGAAYATVTMTNAASSASFSAAVTALGTTAATLLVNSAQTITATMTVPNTITLAFGDTGLLTVTSGIALTINGPVVAADGQQIFANVSGPDDTVGVVNFGNSSVRYVTPQWFGAKQDNTTDDYRALTAAIYAGQVAQSIIPVQLLCSGTRYMTSKALELPKYTHIRGCKSNGSIIKALAGYTDANLMQNWRRSQGTSETAPATTSGTGYPSPILFLQGFQLDAGDQAIDLLNLVHLQESSFIRDLVLQGQTVASSPNATSRDGIRLFTNSDTGANIGLPIENIVFYGQFRRCIDANAISWTYFRAINCSSANRDYIRVVSGEQVSFNDIEILVPRTQTDDTAGDAALSLKDCNNCGGSNIDLGPSGGAWTNYVGLLLDCSATCASFNYFFMNLRTSYNAGSGRYLADIRDKLFNNPSNTDYTDNQYALFSRNLRISQTGSVVSPQIVTNGDISFGRLLGNNTGQGGSALGDIVLPNLGAYRLTNAAGGTSVNMLSLDGSNQGSVCSGSSIATKCIVGPGTILTTTASGGVQIGAPTGGDKGTGTINASSYYVHGTAIASMPLTNASGTITNAPHLVQDTVTLTGGTAGVALAGAAAFTNSTSYTCVCDNDSAVLACRVVQNGGNGFTVSSGAGTDVVRFICAGN